APEWRKKVGPDTNNIEYTSTRQEENERDQGVKKKKTTKMIYRKWSLLTGPVAVVGGVVGAVVLANFIFFDNDPFQKREKANSGGLISNQKGGR
ncbi:hypothetical protein F8388_003908, partial [Cannabis sativa]